MAADATLSVAVVAEVEGFKSGFNQVGVSIGDLQRKILAYKDIVANSLDTKVIAKYNAMIEVTLMELTRLNSIGKKGFDSLGNSVLANGQKVAKGSNQAGMALNDLGRIAQDLPYGFSGIQNNLNPMIESFQRLKTETGSTGGALKAMGSSLLGAGGLGLALSVVSAGILLYQEYQRKAKKATDDSTDSNKKYQDSLNSLADSAAGEISKLSLLYGASQDVSRSLSDRKRAVDALQKQYPSYFKNISDEAILAGKASGAYKQLTQDLINAAVVRGGESLIKEQTSELIKLSLQANVAAMKMKGLTDAQRQVMASGATTIAVDENGDMENLSGLKMRYTNKITEIQRAVEAISSQFNISTLLGFSDDDTKKTKKARKKGETNPFLGIEPQSISGKFKTTANEILISTDLIDNQIERFNGIISSIEPQAYTDALDEYLKATADFESGIKDIGENAISYVGDFFTSLGEAMASGDFSNFGQDILKAFAGFLGQLGQLFIKQGVAEIGFGIAKNLILPGSGVPNIAGGSGMIAAGAAISIGSGLIGAGGGRNNDSGPPRRRIPGFAKGVTNFSGGLAIVGEQGPELVDLPPGSDVIPNNRIGQISQGSQNIILSGSLGIRMGELFVELQREEKIRRRTS